MGEGRTRRVGSIVMDIRRQVERAQRFQALHAGPPLLLPNAWDAGSARLLESLGFSALATTSGGLAWSLGYGDGERLPLSELVAALRRIVRVVEVPVSVDLEAGFGDTLEAVAESVSVILDAGAVGLNLEDGIAHERLRPMGEMVARIAAARKAAEAMGVPAFLNARVDVWITGFGDSDEARVQEALRRAEAYLAAGADGIYPIALADPAIIERLCVEIQAPINIGARPGLPDLASLAELGVRRVSTATRLSLVALGSIRDAATRLRTTGNFNSLVSSLSYDEAQHLFPNL